LSFPSLKQKNTEQMKITDFFFSWIDQGTEVVGQMATLKSGATVYPKRNTDSDLLTWNGSDGSQELVGNLHSQFVKLLEARCGLA
jgi:hypothetical protein